MHISKTCPIIVLSNNKKQIQMQALINTIETLENKREAGTITMEQEAILIDLIARVEKMLS